MTERVKMNQKKNKILFLANWPTPKKEIGNDYAFFKHFKKEPHLRFLGTFNIWLWTKFEKEILKIYILQPIIAFFLSFRYDIVLGYSAQSALPLAFLFRIFKRSTPLIIFDVETFGRPTGRRRLALTRYAIGVVNHVVYASSGQKEFYKKHLPELENRSTHIPIGIGDYEKKLDYEQARLSTDIIAIGKHGKAFRDWKTLMEGFAPVTDKIRLVIVGRSSIGPEDLDGAQIPKNVKLYPYMPIEELGEHVERARFAILPLPERNQSLGQLSILFLMAMGKAVISSKVIGVMDYLDDGKTGLFFNPGDSQGLTKCIIRLVENPDLAVEMGMAARKAVMEKFTAKNMGLLWEKCINEVLAQKRGEF